jgi:prepilin-type N-terminal cleavage/methylation domain-containing protein
LVVLSQLVPRGDGPRHIYGYPWKLKQELYSSRRTKVHCFRRQARVDIAGPIRDKNDRDEVTQSVHLKRRRWSAHLPHAFTLIEILVVVMILGLLAGFAVPSFRMARDKTRKLLIFKNLRQIWDAAQLYFIEHGVDEVPINDLVWYYKPDGVLVKNAEESYTSILKCIVGEDYGKLRTVRTKRTALNVHCSGQLFAETITFPDDRTFDVFSMEAYPLGLFFDTTIIAVPLPANDGVVPWVGLDIDHSQLMMINDHEYGNFYGYYTDEQWGELFKKFWIINGYFGRTYDAVFKLYYEDNDGESHGTQHGGGLLFDTLFDTINRDDAVKKGLENEYDQFKEDMEKLRREFVDNDYKFNNIIDDIDDFKKLFTLRERLYSLGEKLYGRDGFAGWTATAIVDDREVPAYNYDNERYMYEGFNPFD